jgi:peptidoglycan/LPS O-acetylase OafA/YrhL
MLTSHGQHRYEELDSLRGVAAMIVVANHVSMFWSPPYGIWRVRFDQSPLGVLLDGPDAVYLFFVLSGFVLFLPYIRPGGPDPYPQYLIKRVCRIYLPYLAALAVSIVADIAFYRPLHGMFPRWVTWHRPFPMSAVWGHLLFIRHDGLAEFNPAFWSLVHEMRVSIVFPLVAFLALRLSLAWGVVTSLAICMGGFLLVQGLGVSDYSTIGYGGLFVLGAVVARHLGQIRAFVDQRGAFGRTMILAGGFALLKSTHFLPEKYYQFWTIAPLHGSAVTVVMILALTTVHFKRALHLAPLRWLGKVSYSLYLIHGIILYSLASLFWTKTNHHILLLLSGVAFALLVVGSFHHWVERPSILLGRLLTRREPPPAPTSV